MTQRGLAGQGRTTGGDLDQWNEMRVPGNQDGSSKTADSYTQAERQVFRPIRAPRNHILRPAKRTLLVSAIARAHPAHNSLENECIARSESVVTVAKSPYHSLSRF